MYLKLERTRPALTRGAFFGMYPRSLHNFVVSIIVLVSVYLRSRLLAIV